MDYYEIKSIFSSCAIEGNELAVKLLDVIQKIEQKKHLDRETLEWFGDYMKKLGFW